MAETEGVDRWQAASSFSVISSEKPSAQAFLPGRSVFLVKWTVCNDLFSLRNLQCMRVDCVAG